MLPVEQEQLVDDKERTLVLGKKLGAGGEGAVYDVEGYPDRVVKVYHKRPQAEQLKKLQAMIENGSERLTTMSTWPLSLVRNDRGVAIGFIMPKLRSNYKEVLQLYSPANRKTAFPNADYSFIVHAAMNIAAAFDAVHSLGHVIGDVNQKNILVNDQAIITLIDCDSFQIKDSTGKVFPCAVGVAEFTSPELQHKELREVVRTANNEEFGLAVLIFDLLFMGRHPFAGKYLGADDPPDLEQAIGGRMFAYARNSEKTMQYVPPPLSVPVSIFPDTIMNLFERAFLFDGREGTSRPTADEWRTALKQFKDSLITCADDINHKYPSLCARCPWCEFAEHGTFYFGTGSLEIDKLKGFASEVVVNEFENLFQRLKPLTTIDNPIPPGISSGFSVLQKIVQAFYTTHSGELLIIAGFAVFVFAVALNQILIVAIALLGVIAAIVITNKEGSLAYRLEAVANNLAQQRDDLKARLKAAVPETDISLIETMNEKLDAYRKLDSELKVKLRELMDNRTEAQKTEYLSHFPIELCPGLPHTDVSTLRSFFINTAADISQERLSNLPYASGIVRSDVALAWKADLEKKFKPDPKKPLAPSVVHGVIASYKHKAHDIEIELEAKKEQLALMGETYSGLNKTIADLDGVRIKLANAKADLALVKRL